MMQIHSPVFEDGGRIPAKHTADGEDVSIPIAWLGAPPATAELALIMDDPDAPGDEPWVHWVVYHIPPGTERLPEGIHREKTIASPAGVTQGTNSWKEDNLGYRGPAPPPGHGAHRYRLRLYALGRQLELPPAVDKRSLLGAMEGAILEEAELVGTYER